MKSLFRINTQFVSFFFLLFSFQFFIKSNAYESINFIHTDHLGSTSIATNNEGTTIAKSIHYPYGKTRTQNGTLPTEKQYTGQISDQDQTGLYYYNSRYYNPAIAKFTQADVVSDGQNRYAYVGNNPMIYTDPSGNERLLDGERRILNGMSGYGYHRQTDRLTWVPGIAGLNSGRAAMSQTLAQEHVDRYYEYGCGLGCHDTSNKLASINDVLFWKTQGDLYYSGVESALGDPPVNYAAIEMGGDLVGMAAMVGGAYAVSWVSYMIPGYYPATTAILNTPANQITNTFSSSLSQNTVEYFRKISNMIQLTNPNFSSYVTRSTQYVYNNVKSSDLTGTLNNMIKYSRVGRGLYKLAIGHEFRGFDLRTFYNAGGVCSAQSSILAQITNSSSYFRSNTSLVYLLDISNNTVYRHSIVYAKNLLSGSVLWADPTHNFVGTLSELADMYLSFGNVMIK